jgi:hypothetical protein
MISQFQFPFAKHKAPVQTDYTWLQIGGVFIFLLALIALLAYCNSDNEQTPPLTNILKPLNSDGNIQPSPQTQQDTNGAK